MSVRHIDLSSRRVVDWSDRRDLLLDCRRRRDDGDDWNVIVIVGHDVTLFVIEL